VGKMISNNLVHPVIIFILVGGVFLFMCWGVSSLGITINFSFSSDEYSEDYSSSGDYYEEVEVVEDADDEGAGANQLEGLLGEDFAGSISSLVSMGVLLTAGALIFQMIMSGLGRSSSFGEGISN